MEIGIDSFAALRPTNKNPTKEDYVKTIDELLERVEYADKVGLDIYGIGEHYRKEFLDSSPSVILSAAAARTKKIRLTSAVTVISAADPVRVFQNFATLDLISKGRAEIIVGRGSFSESFPLFGLNFKDYDDLFIEKLDLLLKIRNNETITWSGKFRPSLIKQSIYPRPYQNTIPIWLGVGGSPESFIRAGKMGLPLMIAIIGGETRRFRSLVDSYREAGIKAGHSEDSLKVGIHSLGYLGYTQEEAIEEFYPGYAETFSKIGRERGWPPTTRAQYNNQIGPAGALLVGEPDVVIEKIQRHNKDLGGISRLTFQMNVATLPHSKLLQSIQLIGTKVAPSLK
tara:strand:+ start:8382 stop:9404 length:1023 start_codon:yes stop_codon:yes gene_type:complete